MVTDPGRVTFDLQFAAISTDAAGGYAEQYSTILSGGTGWLRNRRPSPTEWQEMLHGVRARREKVLVVYRNQTTLPRISADVSRYRIVTDAGEQYRLRDVNEYESTVQMTVEQVR